MQQRADDSAQDDRAEHNQQGRSVADVSNPVGVQEGDNIERRDHEDDEAESLGDEVTGALRQPAAHQDTHGRADDDRCHVDEGAESDHVRRLAEA